MNGINIQSGPENTSKPEKKVAKKSEEDEDAVVDVQIGEDGDTTEWAKSNATMVLLYCMRHIHIYVYIHTYTYT